MKIGLVDIETKPHQAFVWGMFKQFVNHNQLIERGDIISFGFKWLGDDEVMYMDDHYNTIEEVVDKLHELFDEADILIGHNGDRFDIPYINSLFIRHGRTPPSPSYTIDTLKVAKRTFRFARNTLKNVAEELGCTPKLDHEKFSGFELWSEYMKGNEEAVEEMMVYCKQDVDTLEEVYIKLRPYIKTHPNVSLTVKSDNGRPICSKCGSAHTQYRGYAYTNVSMFRRYQCQSCGGWGRLRSNLINKEDREKVGTNIACGL